MSKVLGIIGGMGPLASADFLRKIVLNTPGKRDQDHIHIIVDVYSQIPDRTEAILGSGESPIPYLIESARKLEICGVDCVVFACNTAYAFLREVQDSVKVEILDLPTLSLSYLKDRGIHHAVLLGTDGLVASGVYQSAARKVGFDLIIPDDETQVKIMEIIYTIKRGNLYEAERLWKSVHSGLSETGLFACTELPLVAKCSTSRIIDLNDIWAKIVVNFCLKTHKRT